MPNIRKITDDFKWEISEILDWEKENIEIKRAKEIKNFFIKNKIKIDYIFDIHSTPTDSEPMIICSNNKKSLELSDFFPIKYVILWLADIIEWVALTKYFSNLWAIDLAFECWFHNDINNKKVWYKIFEIILKIQNSENLNKKFKKIKIKIINSLKTSNKKFRFSKVFKWFEVIKKWEILAKEEDNIISMEEERIMVIPRLDTMEELDFKKEVILWYLWEKI